VFQERAKLTALRLNAAVGERGVNALGLQHQRRDLVRRRKVERLDVRQAHQLADDLRVAFNRETLTVRPVSERAGVAVRSGDQRRRVAVRVRQTPANVYRSDG
jgi:hypothetical protein